jgi:hypothetical protein
MPLIARLRHDTQLSKSRLEQLLHADTQVLLRVRGAPHVKDSLG